MSVALLQVKPSLSEPTVDCLECGFIEAVGTAYDVIQCLVWAGIPIPCPECGLPLDAHGVDDPYPMPEIFGEFIASLN